MLAIPPIIMQTRIDPSISQDSLEERQSIQPLPHIPPPYLIFWFTLHIPKKISVINGYGFHGAPHVNAWVMSRALLWSFGRELYFQLFGNHYHFDYEEIKKGIKILLTRDLGLFRAALTHWLLKRQLWAALRSGNRQTES